MNRFVVLGATIALLLGGVLAPSASVAGSAEIPVGDMPVQVAVSPNGSRAYVTNFGSDSVSVIAVGSNQVVATVKVGALPQGVAVSPDGSRVYVGSFGSGALFSIDTETNRVVDVTDLRGAAVRGITVSADGAYVYAADSMRGVVWVVDTRRAQPVAEIPVGQFPWAVVTDPRKPAVYVTNAVSESVSVIDTGTNQVVQTVPIGSSPEGIAVTSDGSRLYVGAAESVSVIDVGSLRLSSSIPVSHEARGVAVTSDGSTVYATDRQGNTVSVIDTKREQIVATARVGREPDGVAVSPDGSRVFVANSRSDTVSVIRDDVPPGAPQDVLVDSVAAKSVVLAWSAPEPSFPGPSGYEIAVNDGRVVDTKEMLKRVGGLEPNRRYSFTVRAVNEVGKSTGVKVQVRTDTAMSEPRDVEWEPGPTADAIRLLWEPPLYTGSRAIEEYRVEWEKPSGSVDRRTTRKTKIAIAELSPSSRYTFAVRAIDADEDVSPPGVLTLVTPPLPKPKPFTPPEPKPDPGVKQQTAPGSWPRRLVVRSGKAAQIERKSGFVTNAGQTAKLTVTSKSAALKKVTITLKKKRYMMTPTLKRGKRSGRVTLSVAAPAVKVNGVAYGELLSQQTFTVRRITGRSR